MDIKVYSMQGCRWCLKLKEVFKRANLPYTEYILDINITPQEYFESGNHPAIPNFPQCVIDGEVLGGVTPVVEYLVKKNLLKSKK